MPRQPVRVRSPRRCPLHGTAATVAARPGGDREHSTVTMAAVRPADVREHGTAATVAARPGGVR
ncbi:hypothetical protein ACIA6T_05985 [Streptomyces sp. NPDC051740]|uniref:hypothetical protein n=1 Tax=Streptomyces sp. NPDC051740 TaxID=3365673 RepID=UPI003799D419